MFLHITVFKTFTFTQPLFRVFAVMNPQTSTTHPEEIGAQSAGIGVVSLLQIIQNLVTLGLNTIELWTTVVPKLKTHPQLSSHPEHLNLHLLLGLISKHLATKIFDFFPNDLSQDKFPHIMTEPISDQEILKAVKPLLKKKKFCDKSFSIECSNTLNGAVEDILKSITEMCETESMKYAKLTRKVHKSQKRKRSPSPSGSSSSGSGSESSTASDSDSDSDNSDKFDSLFKSSKKGPIKIKQVFQTQKKRLRRRLTTPGEEGRYMVKIELTDTKDLKNCSQNQYWTKVSAKAIFLAGPKTNLFKDVKNMLYDVGRSVKSTPGVECEEVKIDRKKK